MELIVIVALLALLALLAPVFGADSRGLRDPQDAQAPRPGLF